MDNSDCEYVYEDEDECTDEDMDMSTMEDDDGDATWNTGTQGGNNFKTGTRIKMLPCNDLAPEMKRRLNEVVEVLDIPPCAAAVLLREHNWKKDDLFEKFYGDSEKLMDKCGVRNRCFPVKKDDGGGGGGGGGLNLKRTRSSSRKKNTNNKTCAICYEDTTQTLAMPCGHEFCSECWRDYVEHALTEGPSCVRATCPQAECNEVMTEIEVEKAAPELLPKFLSYQLRCFVDSDALTRWCPGKGCERVACAPSASVLEAQNVAQCDACHTQFCVRCGDEPHSPCSCKELVRWIEKCRNESETANWILANTKSCPKCSTRIEKNQGCNHMNCQRCKHEFCWICMGNWSEHGSNTGGYYKCNKFDDKNGDDQSDAAKAKRELDRYLHYYQRYHAHAEAQTFAKKQLRETEARMVQLQETSGNAKWADVEFLKAANEQLVECRRVLKYTYAYAYYLTDESKVLQKERFEYHQEMLERFTEALSESSEKPLAEMDRTDVVNQTRVVDNFMKNILKYVEDGIE